MLGVIQLAATTAAVSTGGGAGVPGWEAWVTLGVIALMLSLLAAGRFGADIVLMGAVLMLVLSGIITPGEAVAGFSNAGVLTVGFLYVLATGLKETGAMTLLTSALLGRPRSALGAQARLIGPVAVLSAFVNNTPLVAAFMPVLSEWSKRIGVPASRLFMPLSFAAILGGICTLIGTSTNLVVSSLVSAENQKIAALNAKAAPGAAPVELLEEWGLWTITPVGLPVALVGMAYMLIAGRRLLPDRGAKSTPIEQARRYMAAMLVPTGSVIVGKTIEQAGLRNLPGVFLSRVDRGAESLVAVGPEQTLLAGDVLMFVGSVESVAELQKMKGLTPAESAESKADYRPNMRLHEAVVSPSSPLVGKTIKEAGIRTRYNAVVVGVHRAGERLPGKIGEIEVRPGDTLLLEARPGFVSAHRDSGEFYLVSELEGSASLRHDKAWVAVAILLGTIALLSWENLFPPMVVAMCSAACMIAFRCCTGPQARAGVEWPVLIVIAASFGVARAMDKTGLASYIASHVIAWAGGMGPWALLGAVYLLSLGFTTLVSNNAAAALVFPIALEVARGQGLNFTPFAVAVAIAASCEFMTPLGYQTNLMVMGPGGYRWGDFMRFGLPLTALCAIVAIGVGPLVFAF
ncbi:MAG: SLC13 family permease [Phycisphaerales bacterium]